MPLFTTLIRVCKVEIRNCNAVFSTRRAFFELVMKELCNKYREDLFTPFMLGVPVEHRPGNWGSFCTKPK